MKEIYRKHQSSNSYSNNEWWDDVYYLCETEEEYMEQLEYYKKKEASAKLDPRYKKYPAYRPWLSKEEEIHAREYYYGHEWTGQNFDAFGFSWHVRYECASETIYILRPNSIKNKSYASNNGCVGWMYGS